MAKDDGITGYWKYIKKEVTRKFKKKRVRMYLAPVRVQDNNGIPREVSRAFDNPNDTKLYLVGDGQLVLVCKCPSWK